MAVLNHTYQYADKGAQSKIQAKGKYAYLILKNKKACFFMSQWQWVNTKTSQIKFLGQNLDL